MFKLLEYAYEKIKEKLSKYIHGGQIKESSSLSRLEIRLEDVKIRHTALDDLYLPIAVHSTSLVKQIILTITRDPKIKLVIEKLRLVLNPSPIRSWTRQQAQEFKLQRLSNWEEKQSSVYSSQSWLSKNISKWFIPALKQVKIKINHLGIYYQDTEALQILGYPCLVMILVNNIEIVKSNEFDSDGFDLTAEIKEFSISMMCDPINFEKDSDLESIYDEMKVSERNFLLKPCDINIKLTLNASDGLNAIAHKISITVKNSIEIALNEYQRYFIEGLIYLLNSRGPFMKYYSFKPTESIKIEKDKWWQFIVKSAKFDRRVNIMNIYFSQRKKNQYLELYKRKQKIVHAPWLQPLKADEEEKIREIEELFSYDELIVLRAKALKDIRLEACEMYPYSFAESSKENKTLDEVREETQKNEEIKNYFKEWHSHLIEHHNKNRGEDNEESTQTAAKPESDTETKHNLYISWNIDRVIFYLQRLKCSSLPAFAIISKENCSCFKCNPVRLEKQKQKSSKSTQRLLTDYGTTVGSDDDEKDIFKIEGFKRMGPPRIRLMPLIKMRDTAIEYGEEMYSIGAVGYKNQSDDPYEPNIVKEQTIFIFLLQNLTGEIKIGSDNIKTTTPIMIENIQIIDPMSFAYNLKPENIKYKQRDTKPVCDIYFYKSWLDDVIFEQGKMNKYPTWCLRHFMRDVGLLEEFEIMAHMREVENDKIVCVCGSHWRSAKAMIERFIARPNSIHISPELKATFNKSTDIEKLKVIVNSIENFFLNEILPFYLRNCIRYFFRYLPISYIRSENPNFSLTLDISRKKTDLKESISNGIIDVALYPLTILLSNYGLSSFLSWIKLPSPPEMIKKPIFQSTFLKTLESIPQDVSFVYDILKNWERNPNTLLADTYRVLEGKSNLEIMAHFSNITICLFEAKNFKSYKSEPIANVALLNTIIHKAKRQEIGTIPPTVYEQRQFTTDNRYIDPALYGELSIEISEIIVSINQSVILNTSFKVELKECAAKSHPIMPVTFIDVKIPFIEFLYKPEIPPLLSYILSIEVDSPLQEISDYKEVFANKIEDYRKKLFDLDKKMATRLLMKYQTDHYYSNKQRCRHCLIKHIKLNKIITISLGIETKNAVKIEIETKNEPNFQIKLEQAVVVIKEKLFTKRVNCFISDIYGSNNHGEQLLISPGTGHLSVSPCIPHYLLPFLPFYSQFFSTQSSDDSVPLYQLFKMKELSNTDIFIETAWDKKEQLPPERQSLQKFPSHLAKSGSHLSKYGRKQSAYFILDNEVYAKIFIDSIRLHIILENCSSPLLEALGMIEQSFNIANSFSLKNMPTAIKYKSKNARFKLNLKEMNLLISFNEFPLEFSLKNIKLNKSPTKSIPDFLQSTLEKNRENSITFHHEVALIISSSAINVLGCLNCKLNEIAINIQNIKDTKARENGGELIISSSSERCKLISEIRSFQVFTLDEPPVLILACPSICSNEKIVPTVNGKIKIQGSFEDFNEVFVSILDTGIIIESSIVKNFIQIVHTANIETTMKIFNSKQENFSRNILVKEIKKKSKNSDRLQLIIKVATALIQIKNNSTLIGVLKFHNLYLHQNTPKEILIKYIDSLTKNTIDISPLKENIYEYEASSKNIHLFLKKIEILPVKCLYFQLVDQSKDYSTLININKEEKQILILIKDAKLIMVNRFVEELIQFIKSIKDFEKSARKIAKPPSKNYIVRVIATNGTVSIPTDSSGNDMAIAVFQEVRVLTGEGDAKFKTPKSITSDVELIENKYPIQDSYNPSSFVYCDTVSIKIHGVKAFTKLKDKTKKIAKLSSAELSIAIPFHSQPLVEHQWKIDSKISINLENVSLTGSMSKIESLQKIMKTNFDEKLLTFEKVIKWDKIDFGFKIGEAGMEMNQRAEPEITTPPEIAIEESKIEREDSNLEWDLRHTPGFPFAPAGWGQSRVVTSPSSDFDTIREYREDYGSFRPRIEPDFPEEEPKNESDY
ncbi:unnamed protein product [Blepharisma stoltei]|uniref:Uncharacterized protein n=1 Tax=Blepharisma stoltei TaxID=1481888 RepID=A0AAU9JRP7_9CILI|nr:unnamed protein product [Blepharisma stoltei]